ncbi:MAG: 5-histidylcysteine sulfoxide synthase [Halothiobacillaceae bacterium]
MLSRLKSRSVLLTGQDAETQREAVRAYFHRTMDVYELLFEVLTDDQAFYERPEPLRHPLIFYFGHTATFYINKLVTAKATTRIDPQLEGMFAIGVDEMSWDDLNDAHYDWPSVDRVREYRRAVRERVDQLIGEFDWTPPVHWQDHPTWSVVMGIEHERIHLETSSVLIRQLDPQWVRPHEDWPVCDRAATTPAAAPRNELADVSGGTVVQGKLRDAPLYGWDNEYGRLETTVKPFRASRMLVSNAEFLAFVEAGGYQTPEWWTEEGRRWLEFRGASHPVFWVPRSDSYAYRAMTHDIDMPWDWPVDVNYLEAKAFCHWLSETSGQSIRLPIEPEYERLRTVTGVPDEPDWGERAPGNINLEYWASACPVDRFAHGEFFDVIGNVWQWTETPIDAFEGFEPHPIYDDFSVPTFDGQHNLIKGGSWISTGNEATRDARYAFRRHFFQHAGFRYVEGKPVRPPASKSDGYYETDAQLAQYCDSHYGRSYFGVANFPRTLVEYALRQMEGRAHGAALDIGCATGRATFELAPHFDSVTGLDFSARFIQIAQAMLDEGQIAYALPTEGELTEDRAASLAALGLEPRDNITFWQQDACNMKPHFTGYDLVLAGNLIDRLYDPGKFLDDITGRINPGGLLVLASPYTWLEEFTPREHWLGGFVEDGRPVTTLEALIKRLEPSFELVGEPADIPFVIRDTARRYQHTVSQVTVWSRR